MPAGKKYQYKKKTYKKRGKYKNRVATKVTTEAVQKALRPLQELKYIQNDRSDTSHFTFNAAATPLPGVAGQMSINARVVGLCPKDCTIVPVPSFLHLFTQGAQRDEVEGRVLRSRSLQMRLEIDWSGTHANSSALTDHWFIYKGWCKNTVMKSTSDPNDNTVAHLPPLRLPLTVAEHGVQCARLIAKAMEQQGIGNDPLQFRAPGSRNIIIEKVVKVKHNLNDRPLAANAIVNDPAHPGVPDIPLEAWCMPNRYYFNWKFNRKQLLDNHTSPYGGPVGAAGGQGLGMFRSYIPFVALVNRNLTSEAHTFTPTLSTSSRLRFTDM